MNTDEVSRATTANEVWVIEDNPTFRRALAVLLNRDPELRCGLAVETCEEAIRQIDAGRRPAVVLMDVGLPGMNGIEGTRRIRALAPSTDVIILTIHEDSDQVFHAILAGATGYLLKPSTPDEIASAVRQVRRGDAAINPAIARRILELLPKVVTPTTVPDYGLTGREHEILQLMVEGLTIRQTAARLEVSFHTVDTHIRNIYAKLHVHSRAMAVGKAVSERLV